MSKIAPNKQASYMLAYSYLKNGVIEGRFSEDKIFIEENIAEELGVSRTPVREAIRMLKSEKLLVSVPHKGIMCRSVPQSEIKSVYEVAEALEGMMAYIVAKNNSRADNQCLESCVIRMEKSVVENDKATWVEADRQFHRCLMEFSRNSFLEDAMESLNVYIAMIRNRYSKENAESQRQSTVQHREAFEAINAGEADYARMVVQFHWRSIRRQLCDKL